MAVKSEYYLLNGGAWELQYFRTSIDQVDDLQAALDGKLASNGKAADSEKLDGYDWKYVHSRGQNLFTNGSALLGDNTNMSPFIFDGSQAHYSGGSFKYYSANTLYTDELMPVDVNKKYRMSIDAKSLNGVGRYYMMTVCFDVDNLSINANHHMYKANTLTTLAQELKNGDTVVYLTNATNWDNSGVAGVNTHLRSIILWNYMNSFGYLYPPETYSRNWTGNAWDPGAINFTNNTITLRVPWAGGTIPAGTYLSNGSSGGTFKYNVMSNVVIPQSWSHYEGIMDGVDLSGTNISTKFPPGTAKIKLGWLMNYQGSGETVWFTNIKVTEDYYSPNNKPSISDLGISPATIGALPNSGGTISGDTIFDDGTATSPELRFKNQSYILGIDLYNNTKRLRFIDRTAGVSRIEFDMNDGSIIASIASLNTRLSTPLIYTNMIDSDSGSVGFGSGLDNVNFNNVPLINVPNPTANSHAANKEYVDNLLLSNPVIDAGGVDFAIGNIAGKNRLMSYAAGTPIRFFDYNNAYAKIAVNDVILDNVNSLNTLLNGKVPTSRKINNKVLTSDITLALSDLSDINDDGKDDGEVLTWSVSLNKAYFAPLPAPSMPGWTLISQTFSPVAVAGNSGALSYNTGAGSKTTYKEFVVIMFTNSAADANGGTAFMPNVNGSSQQTLYVSYTANGAFSEGRVVIADTTITFYNGSTSSGTRYFYLYGR